MIQKALIQGWNITAHRYNQLYQIFHIKATDYVEKKYIYISIIYNHKNVHYDSRFDQLIVSVYVIYTTSCVKNIFPDK